MIFQRLESVFWAGQKSSPIFKKYVLHESECFNTSKNVRDLSLVLKYAPECWVTLGFVLAWLDIFGVLSGWSTRSAPAYHPAQPENDDWKPISGDLEGLMSSILVQKLQLSTSFQPKKNTSISYQVQDLRELPTGDLYHARLTSLKLYDQRRGCICWTMGTEDFKFCRKMQLSNTFQQKKELWNISPGPGAIGKVRVS